MSLFPQVAQLIRRSVSVVAAAVVLASAAQAPSVRAATPLPTTAEQYVAMQRGDVEGRSFTGDGGAAVRTKNGAFVSFYGDSFVFPSEMPNPRYPRAAQQPPYMMRNNALIITPAGHVKSAVSSANLLAKKSLIDVPAADQLPGGQNFYWPASAAVQGTNLIYVFLWQMYTPDGGGTWDFRHIGTKLAVYRLDSYSNLVFQRLQATPTGANNPDAIGWGSGVYFEGGYMYVFGSHKPAGDYVWGYDHYIARVPVGYASKLSAWRYWDGSAWKADRKLAVPIIPYSAGVEGSIMLTKDPATGRYTFVYKQFAFIGQNIMRGTSTKLEGPWTIESTPAAVLPPYSDQDYTYCGVEIPLAEGKRGIIVSHGENSPWPPMSEIGIRPVN